MAAGTSSPANGSGSQVGLALAPDATTVDMIAALVAQRHPITQVRNWEQQATWHRRLVGSAQHQARIPARQMSQRHPPARLSDRVENEAVDDTHAQEREQLTAHRLG